MFDLQCPLMPCPPPPGFSTLEQLKRRNTLKDGIIMIQTLLIILFIIVPIFLLLDKVPTGAGGPREGWEVGTGQTGHGQGLHSLRLCGRSSSPKSCSLAHCSFIHLVLETPSSSPHPIPHPWPITGRRWRALTF